MNTVRCFIEQFDSLQKRCIYSHLSGLFSEIREDVAACFDSWMMKNDMQNQPLPPAYDTLTRLTTDLVAFKLDHSMDSIDYSDVSRLWNTLAGNFFVNIGEKLTSNPLVVTEFLKALCAGLEALRKKVQNEVKSAFYLYTFMCPPIISNWTTIVTTISDLPETVSVKLFSEKRFSGYGHSVVRKSKRRHFLSDFYVHIIVRKVFNFR